jgi:hypothetical protein
MDKISPDPWIFFGNRYQLDQSFIFLKGPFMFFSLVASLTESA